MRPGVNDGASCVLVASEEWAARRGIEPLATIVSQGYVADEFAYLARTPAKAAGVALAKAGKTISDVRRVEINEAFASVAAHSARLLGADEEIVNVNGGAVALGHPVGASGGRILTTLVYELRRQGGGLGVAAICSGGGGGRRVADRSMTEADGSRFAPQAASLFATARCCSSTGRTTATGRSRKASSTPASPGRRRPSVRSRRRPA